MIRFLFKGLVRDRSRSLFPFLTVVMGVTLVVFLHAWINGAVSSLIQTTAHFSAGYLRLSTRAYAKEADQSPNDLALLGIDTLERDLKRDYPDVLWTPRTTFGGLLDVPNAQHETRDQAPVAGMAVDLLSAGSPEGWILNIRGAIVRGRAPEHHGEILIGEELAERLHVQPGDTATLITSTMFGSMSLTNFRIAGTVRFGIVAMDRGMVVADIADIQQALDMQAGAGVILGFFRDDVYHEERANDVTADFNRRYGAPGPQVGETGPDGGATAFQPLMATFRTASGLSDYLDYVDVLSGVIVAVFLFTMGIVLWNAGLTGGLRRYGEIGLRLAVGENRTHVYWTLILESLMIGCTGSIVGTVLGLGAGYYLQIHGFDIASIMKDSTMLLPTVVRARITPLTFAIGFFPGLLATFAGTAMSGIGIYRRQTSQLFKELET